MAVISAKTRILMNLFVPQRRKPNPRHAIPESDKELTGKTLVFTGGTDGIGRVAVEMFYRMGANITLLGRNETKGERVIRELRAIDGSGKVEFEECDLALMQSVHDCTDRILAKPNRIDILVNCAGLYTTRRHVTAEGLEAVWTTNYLGPFLLTNRLLPRILESKASRIINITTNTDFLNHIDFDDLQSEHDFGRAYTQAKLALSMFTLELYKKIRGSGVTVNCLHPGYIKSNLLRDLDKSQNIMRLVMQVMASPTEVGAERIVRLAISSAYQGVTGTFVSEDDIQPPHAEARDGAKRERLMQISEGAVAQWL